MRKRDLTEGNVLSVITRLAIPIMGSSLLQFTYNLIDMLWVGNLGSNAVASIGACSFYIGLGYSINAFIVIGTGIKVSHALGEKNEHKVHQYINNGTFLNIVVGILYAIILIAFGKNIIRFLNMKNYQVEIEAYKYLFINAFILFFSFFNFLYTRILGSYGDNKTAFKINSIGMIINIIVDPILIYTFGFGVAGAALATLISAIVMFILYLTKTNKILLYKKESKISFTGIKEIVKLGLPMSTQRILFTFINILLAKIVAIYGSDAIAAQKIGLQVESITYMVIGGLNGAIASFTGQNFGAKKYSRILKGYKASLKIGLTYSVFTSIILFLFNIPIVKLFVREEKTVIIAGAYLTTVAYTQIFSTIEMVSNGMFTGLGMPKIPAGISIIFTVLRIPMALIFIKYYGVNGVWISIATSSALKGISAYIMYIICVRRKYGQNKRIEESI